MTSHRSNREPLKLSPMPIFPRSPRETLGGWMHLPRYIDKIRLHLAGQLPADYQPNFGKGFDGAWLKAAGVTHEQMIAVVQQSIIDGQVADWVRVHVPATPEQQRQHAEGMLNYPPAGDAAMQDRLKQRKAAAGLAHRDDIQTFVDFIDADEGRL